MKKIKFDSKLKLNKETITKLNDKQMNGVKGGLLSIGHEFSVKNSCARVGTCSPKW